MKLCAVYCWWHFEDTCSCSWVDWKTIRLGIFLDVVYVPQSVYQILSVIKFLQAKNKTSKKKKKTLKTILATKFQIFKARGKKRALLHIYTWISWDSKNLNFTALFSWTKDYPHYFYKFEMTAFLATYVVCMMVDILCSLKLLETFLQ